jgi:acyl-coenzyme A synthetase/AMP-(fatty) acid ligase
VLGLKFSKLRVVGSTGSPAGDGLFKWVADNVEGAGGQPVKFVSTSGGTDLNGSFYGGKGPYTQYFYTDISQGLFQLV